ncbi:MAG TPA: GNAT family N-acetyltransferase [Acidimicrobiales bacterium]|nr:GNAT family N-acetyltransferase [Acidimicrobiales bacterium]
MRHRPAPVLRAPAPHELDAFAACVEAAFVFSFPDDERELFLAALDPGRCLVAEAGGAVLGTLASHLVELTVPGPRPLRVAALTDLGVAPTHRRQGLGGRLVARFLEDAHDRGEAVALLEAGDGGFYRRFGFAPASWANEYRIAPGRAVANEPGSPPGSLVQLRPDEALEALPAIFDRHRRASVGEITRTAEEWRRLLVTDKGADRTGFVVAHEADGELDGYLRYRALVGASGREVRLEELVATTPAAYRALGWVIGSLGEGVTITTAPRPVDEPLRHLLRDPGACEVVAQRHRGWLRLVDLPGALGGRSYAAAGAVTLEVEDPGCPWNARCWRLEVDPGGRGRAVANEEGGELRLGVDALAATYLGATSFARLTEVGAAREEVAGAAARADRLFLFGRAPFQGAEL